MACARNTRAREGEIAESHTAVVALVQWVGELWCFDAASRFANEAFVNAMMKYEWLTQAIPLKKEYSTRSPAQFLILTLRKEIVARRIRKSNHR